MNEISANPSKSMSLSPKSLDEAIRFAEMLSKAEIVPKDFQGKAGNILVAIQWGMELGLQPMQAMQNIAIINGRPSLWGDAVIALCKGSPACEYIVEEVTDSAAICKVKRKGEPEQSRTFTMEDAQRAGLKGKSGPWSQYPKRMMQMRARSWALRDVFPDVLRGMPVAEEQMDATEIDVTPPRQEEAAPTELPAYPDEKLVENLPNWRAAVNAGRTNAAKLINMVSAKYTLNLDQTRQIQALEFIEAEPETTNELPPENTGEEYGENR